MTSADTAQLGQFIRERRIAKGITLKQFSTGSGLGFTQLQKIETNKSTGVPYKKSLARISKALFLNKIETQKLYYLAGYEEALESVEMIALNSVERELIDEYRQLSAGQQRTVKGVVSTVLQMELDESSN